MHKHLSSQHVKCVRYWGYLQIKEMAPYLKALSLVGQINKQTSKYNSAMGTEKGYLYPKRSGQARPTPQPEPVRVEQPQEEPGGVNREKTRKRHPKLRAARAKSTALKRTYLCKNHR